MTLISQIDLAFSHQRGLGVGINEAAGSVAAGASGFGAAWLATEIGARPALLIFGLATIALAFALLLGMRDIIDTIAWVKAEHAEAHAAAPENAAPTPKLSRIFFDISFSDPAGRALCQGGAANKIADALVWILFPLFFKKRGASLVEIGWLTGAYAAAFSQERPEGVAGRLDAPVGTAQKPWSRATVWPGSIPGFCHQMGRKFLPHRRPRSSVT